MRTATVGLAALLAVGFGGPVAAQSLEEEIQQETAPGSEIEAEIGGGEVLIGREKNMPPEDVEALPPSATRVPVSPIVVDGEAPLDVPDDPDEPVSPDAIDAELPGEGPEDLSGPDDDDPLPE